MRPGEWGADEHAPFLNPSTTHSPGRIIVRPSLKGALRLRKEGRTPMRPGEWGADEHAPFLNPSTTHSPGLIIVRPSLVERIEVRLSL
jgi:hypothetical protein